MTAANIDKHWVRLSADEVIGAALGRRVVALNDADAAGLAEIRFGAGRDCNGTVLVLTVGTGIGSALFVDGRLVPNTELGHLEVSGRDAETRIIRRGARSAPPALAVVGDGVQRVPGTARGLLLARPDHPRRRREQGHRTSTDRSCASRAPIVAGTVPEHAGIIGAAMYAAETYAAELARRVKRPPSTAGARSRADRRERCRSTYSTRPTSCSAPTSRRARSDSTRAGNPANATIGLIESTL